MPSVYDLAHCVCLFIFLKINNGNHIFLKYFIGHNLFLCPLSPAFPARSKRFKRVDDPDPQIRVSAKRTNQSAKISPKIVCIPIYVYSGGARFKYPISTSQV
jgi:hypothetical protein